MDQPERAGEPPRLIQRPDFAGTLAAITAQRQALRQTAHRPWEPSARRWVIGQSWVDLLFIHWQVGLEDLRRLVPPSLDIDVFDGSCWIGIVPFRMRAVHFRGCPPLVGTSTFPEVNVRTYVTVGGKPGVFFLTLDTANPVAVSLGRRMYGLPYMRARVAMQTDKALTTVRSVRVQSGWPSASLTAAYSPAGESTEAPPGTLTHWLTERYCFYTVGKSGRILRTEVHHAPWQLRDAEVQIDEQTLLEPFGLEVNPAERLVHHSQAQHVVAWTPTRVT